MTRKWRFIFSIAGLLGVVLIVNACKKDPNPDEFGGGTPYPLVTPIGLPKMTIPANNPLTVEGVALGRKLFYDKILSADNTMSCASCHVQSYGFTDNGKQYSLGIDKMAGTRNAMPLFNLGYQKKFFWDGGAADLESQVIGPIQNPVEMHADLGNVLHKLNTSTEYPALFHKAFGNTDTITSALLMMAIAQFERTMLSGNSRYDKYVAGTATLTAQELRGMALYENGSKGDCTHCHTLGGTFSDFEFRNNGVDSIYTDAGRYKITLIAADSGKFKTPSLRNIAVTAPYMHDGRFQTLQQVMDHYNTGFHHGRQLDPVLATQPKNRMTAQDMQDIIAFLNTLTDSSFLNNAGFSKP